jgi:DNA-binding transcriptional ArsR family regulator
MSDPTPAGRDPFDALGDLNRRAIVELLREGNRSVREIADELPISRPAVSRHLRLLKEAGLVEDTADGARRLYHLQDQGLEEIRAYLERVWGEAGTRFRLTAANTEPRSERR